MSAVFLVERHWERKGHGGLSKETDYEIFLNKMRLRGFSTHGNMTEGYWGYRAKPCAEAYAAEVAAAAGCRVLRVRSKTQ